ncbi:response regulator [Paenibacillus sp. sptzw28]|uniref:response regulator n=1 Tax=Paenibacillus sp. sptzw28 TaxID=715179 RepID=UPI001C6F1206|nr:response regulator [Paenibacillus sp. sptzw28]QYR22888.1 response regulator [Paenibacillus sp. sptzw28]
MIKVLLADDHYPVLEFLAQSVAWKELGMEVVALCSDGEEALAQCKAHHPDILITDIGMPRMDGLALTEALRDEGGDVEVIILSCLDEFQYAQRAVKLGVQDYLLKESLQPEELTEVLRRLTDRIKTRHGVRLKNDELIRVLDRNTPSIKAEFIRNTISNPIINEHKWLSELREFGIEAVTQPVMPVLLYPNRYLELKERFRTEELFSYAVDNVITEMIDKPGAGASFRYSTKQTFLLFPFVKSLKVNPYEGIRANLNALFKTFQRLGITMSAMTCEPASNLSELKMNLMTLASAFDQRFYASEESIYKWIPFQTSKTNIFFHYQKALDDFRQLIALESGDYQLVVKEWMQLLRDERFPVDSVRAWVLKLMMDIELKLSSLSHFHDRQTVKPLYDSLTHVESLSEIERFLNEFLQEKIRHAGTIKHVSQRQEIYEAKKYVSARLHEKISMEDAAQILHMNPSHFSRIFKQETGETFIEYVTRVKMERAKESLDRTDKTVEQISESLGYDNTSYFIKLFKAFSGYSPKDYRVQK